MARTGGGRGDISTRISLEGGDEIKKQLAELGAAGEKALGQLDVASAAGSVGLGRLSAATASISTAFASTRQALSPLSTAFGELHQKTTQCGAGLTNVGDKVFPHFRTIAGLALGVSVAGFVALTKSSAAAADEVGKTADRLGIGVKAYQNLRFAAGQAGVNTEEFTKAFQRLGQTVAATAEEQLKGADAIVLQLVGDIAIGVPSILRGLKDVAKSGVEGGVAVLRGADQASGGFVSLGKMSDETQKKIEGFAEVLKSRLDDAGAGAGISVKSLTAQMIQLQDTAGTAGVEFRNKLRGFGIDLVPKTVGESLARLESQFSTKLGSMVNTLEVVDGKVKTRDLDKIFLDLADRIKAAQDPARELGIIGDSLGQKLGPKFRQFLMEGSGGIAQMLVAGNKANIQFSKLDTIVGQNLNDAFDRMGFALRGAKDLLGLTFAPALQPAIDAITNSVSDNQVAIRAWAAGIATRATPAIGDLITLLRNLGKEEADQAPLQTEFGKNLRSAFFGIEQIIIGVGTAFSILVEAIDLLIAKPINAIFGTELNGQIIVIGLALAQISGAFGLISAGAGLVTSAFWLMLAPLAPLTTAIIGLDAALAVPLLVTLGSLAIAVGIVSVAIVAWNTNWAELGRTGLAFYEMMKSIVIFLAAPFIDAIKVVVAVMTGNWARAFDIIAARAKTTGSVLGWLKDAAVAAGSAIASAFGASGATAAPGGGDPALGNNARGGLIRGPGTGTSDSIRALLSDGEFVIRASAVRHFGVGIFEALNRLRTPQFSLGGLVDGLSRPLMPRPPRFADGGLVAIGAAAGGSSRPRCICTWAARNSCWIPTRRPPSASCGMRANGQSYRPVASRALREAGMADEEQTNAVAYVFGVQAAQNILLRTLYCKWAIGQPEPERFIVELIEETIGSMDAVRPPVLDPAELALMTEIEAELRSFGEQVRMRLAAWKR